MTIVVGNRFKIRYGQYINDGRKKWSDEDNKVWAVCKSGNNEDKKGGRQSKSGV